MTAFRPVLSPLRATIPAVARTTATTPGMLAPGDVVVMVELASGYRIEDPPAPSAGTGTVEDPVCRVSGRTDSITR